MQQEQLNNLKNLTGVDFEFIPKNKNKFGIKYYEHKCETDDEYQRIAGIFNEFDIAYTCIEHPNGTCSIIVLENNLDANRFKCITHNLISNPDELKPIGQINGNDVFLEPILTTDKTYKTIVATGGRTIAVVNINGRRLPFYISSGAAGKEKEFGIPSGKWYALQGISEAGWLNKMPNMLHNPYPELDQICEILERNFPAQEFKQKASKNLLPNADYAALLDAANKDFPEGMPFNENPSYQYLKNHMVYLPQIINAWRSKPDDFLNVQSGILASKAQNILYKVQKLNLTYASKLENDRIWLYPATDEIIYGDQCTETKLWDDLSRLGIVAYEYCTKNNEPGVGIPLYIFEDYFNNQKTIKTQKSEQFHDATNRIHTGYEKTPTQKNRNKTPVFINNLLNFFAK